MAGSQIQGMTDHTVTTLDRDIYGPRFYAELESKGIDIAEFAVVNGWDPEHLPVLFSGTTLKLPGFEEAQTTPPVALGHVLATNSAAKVAKRHGLTASQLAACSDPDSVISVATKISDGSVTGRTTNGIPVVRFDLQRQLNVVTAAAPEGYDMKLENFRVLNNLSANTGAHAPSVLLCK